MGDSIKQWLMSPLGMIGVHDNETVMDAIYRVLEDRGLKVEGMTIDENGNVTASVQKEDSRLMHIDITIK